MNKKKGGSPVDLSASVTASLEIKGTIPRKALGRLADAVVDAFSPFTEAQGLKGDLLRLRREEVLLEIAYRAKLRADLSREERRPLPMKFLVPFVERASLEDTDSELVDWWAGLLAAASTNSIARHPIFPDLLSKFTPAEVRALNTISGSTSREKLRQGELDFDALFQQCLPFYHFHNSHLPADKSVFRAYFDEYRARVASEGALITYFYASYDFYRNGRLNPDVAEYRFDISDQSEFLAVARGSAVDVLLALGVIEKAYRKFRVPAGLLSNHSAFVFALAPTRIGRELLLACLPTLPTTT